MAIVCQMILQNQAIKGRMILLVGANQGELP